MLLCPYFCQSVHNSDVNFHLTEVMKQIRDVTFENENNASFLIKF